MTTLKILYGIEEDDMAIPKKQVDRLKDKVREIPVEDLKHVVGGGPDPDKNPLFQISPNGLANVSPNAVLNLNRVFNPNNNTGNSGGG